VALAAANCLYAGAFPASEVALRTIGPLTLAGLRFAIAALVLSPIAMPVIRRLSTGQLVRIAAVASIGLWGQMVLIYLGINHSNSAIAAIIVGLEPVMIAVWAALLLNERFVARTAAALCIGLVGSLLVAGLGRADGASLAGLLFLLGTGVAFSWYTVASKSFLGMCSPVELTAVISVAGAIWALAPMLAEIALGNGFNGTEPQSWVMVLYLGIGNSVIAYSLWNRALHGLPAAAVGASLYAQPILGAGLSWLLLRDALPATFLPGAVLVLAGVYVASSARTRVPESLPESMP
jgi:drug/metabolite transporter (DMT)-like permease